MTLLDRHTTNDANATQPMDALDAYTVPVRPSGPLTPSASQSGIHRVYVTDAGTPKRITRPVQAKPEQIALERESDPRAGQSHIYPYPVLYIVGYKVADEARQHLHDDEAIHMTTTITHDGVTLHCTIAGCNPEGCYFSASGMFQQGNFNGLWGNVTHQWPELLTATWGFGLVVPTAQFDRACWDRVKAAYQQYGRKGA